MSTYIILANYTDQGIRDIKQSPQRLDAARHAVREAGGEMKEFFLTLGAYDFITFVEASSDADLAKILLSLGSLGNVRTTTVRAFTESEYRSIIDALP